MCLVLEPSPKVPGLRIKRWAWLGACMLQAVARQVKECDKITHTHTPSCFPERLACAWCSNPPLKSLVEEKNGHGCIGSAWLACCMTSQGK